MGLVSELTRADIAAAYEAGRSAVVALIEQIIEINTDQQQRIEQQEQRIATLERELQELRTDSHDSGKPPSRDSFERKQQERKRKSRKERRRRPGGQPDHAGAALCQVEEPTRTTIHTVADCRCGSSLREQPVAGYERRQVFDVPPLAVEVSEHWEFTDRNHQGRDRHAPARGRGDAAVCHRPTLQVRHPSSVTTTVRR